MWTFHQTQSHWEPCHFPHPLSTAVHIYGYDLLSEPPIFVLIRTRMCLNGNNHKGISLGNQSEEEWNHILRDPEKKT